ncbi:uncharacterized protein LOC133799479 isoform X2 [Humulus lupulus]|uniref:uncharacterized protein LOC133799479 isoform X2 n=1 Tax=Humulus lupulus TaxID=3486 RepID=UPI002B414801|nr:uncharacterized protein LOC133799479 isoform X2 [Humulus lupulus]
MIEEEGLCFFQFREKALKIEDYIKAKIRSPAMDNGYDGKLAEKFSGLKLGLGLGMGSSIGDPSSDDNANNPNDSSLFQVMKAVEAAEATIKQQVDENNRLRAELQHKSLLLQKYKLDESGSLRSHSGAAHGHGSYESPPSAPFVKSQQDRDKSMNNTSAVSLPGTLVVHHDVKPNNDVTTQSHAEPHSDTSKINGTVKLHPGGHPPVDNAGFSASSTTSFSPGRFQMEGDYDSRFNLSGQGLMPMTEINNSTSLWKQDLTPKIREHEEEIMQLRKHLADYSIKEAQIRNEKHVLEKRIAYMRLAFDQQQQDLVDAASKALSYRQDIIEENIRLTYALQDAQQERSTFVSSLLPLLAEYSLQPPVPDAQSIVSNVKVLFKHLQEKLYLTESKLKESQYQLTPWRSDVNNSNIAPPSPSHSISAALAPSNMSGLELVPQLNYTPGTGKELLSNSDAQTTAEWDLLDRHQSGTVGVATNHMESDDLGRYSPLASRTSLAQDIPTQITLSHGDAHVAQYTEDSANKQVTFRDPVSHGEMDERGAEGNQNERESSANWTSGNSPYTTTLEDPSSSYPYLPPVLEEPSSSFSEAADDDPLPAIDALQISGEAYPGHELQACGYSIHGTTSCNFEWVRHLEDGSVNYIEGAKQPNYLVTADDVDTYLAIEVQPLDNRKRKGELVKVFANGKEKITCDSDMQNHIEKTLHNGQASYKVLYSSGYLDIWEPATLAIKRDAYSIKSSSANGVVLTEKFSPSTIVAIPYGSLTEFNITGLGGVEHLLKIDNSADISCSRDTIVLALRLFIRRASERRKGKGKKRGLFFNK